MYPIFQISTLDERIYRNMGVKKLEIPQYTYPDIL
jgi:hypothetical protein